MQVIPFVHEGLGNSSYLVEFDRGRALLVDPDRTAHRYLALAESRGLRVEAVLETHLHADFVSGAREVEATAGARIFLPSGGGTLFPHQPVEAGVRLLLDGIEVEPIASPGHTPEHIAYVLRTSGGAEALFSGGSVIVGGAARTDLIASEMTERLTRAQFHTLREAFVSLPDATPLYPTHGGGSFCSAGSGERRTSTLGEERASNTAMSVDDEDEFVEWFPKTFPAIPAYFFRMRGVNQQGPRLRSEIAMPAPVATEDMEVAGSSALLVDTRPAAAFLDAHIPGAISIPFRDSFAVWLGWLIPPDRPLIFVTNGVSVDRIVDEALLVGYEQFAGYLDGGMDAWRAAHRPVQEGSAISVADARAAAREGAAFIDVRERDEYAAGHIEGALNVPLGLLADEIERVPRDRRLMVYCAAGDRSASAVSILERSGIEARSIVGGTGDWSRELPLRQ